MEDFLPIQAISADAARETLTSAHQRSHSELEKLYAEASNYKDIAGRLEL